jgi:hypothetical protein
MFWTSFAFYPPFVKSIVAENVFQFKQIIATLLKIQRFPAFSTQSIAFIGPEGKKSFYPSTLLRAGFFSAEF